MLFVLNTYIYLKAEYRKHFLSVFVYILPKKISIRQLKIRKAEKR